MKALLSRISSLRHLSDETLSNLISGEMSALSSLRAKHHLGRCWQCRTRHDELERGARLVVEFRKMRLDSCLPLDPRPRQAFLNKLDTQDVQFKKPAANRRLKLSVDYRSMRTGHIFCALLLLVFGIGFLFGHRNAPPASASELLRRAEASDADRVREGMAGVLYQDVTIRHGARTFRHAVYRDLAGQRKPRPVAVGSEQAAVEQELKRAGVDWTQPLSARSYQAWRDRLPSVIDHVERSGSHNLTIVSATESGDVAQESLTIREDDFHPVERTVQLRDRDTIEVAELDYAVLGWNTINDSLFTPLAAVASPLRGRHAALAAPSVPSTAQLMAAEVRARVALHNIGADLGEPLIIELKPHAGTVLVTGLESSSAREQQLLSALSGIPDLTVKVQTVDEAVAKTLGVQTSEAAPGSVYVVDGQPAIEAQLLQRFPDEAERQAFVNQALEAVDLAMAHAWAIRRIEERYQGNQIGQVDPAGREALHLLVQDHIDALQKQAKSLGSMMCKLNPSSASPASISNKRSAAVSWHDLMLTTFRSAQSLQQQLRSLLTGSTAPEDSGTLSDGIQRSLSDLQANLAALAARPDRPL